MVSRPSGSQWPTQYPLGRGGRGGVNWGGGAIEVAYYDAQLHIQYVPRQNVPRQNVPGTKRPQGQNVPGKNVPCDKTSQRTKRPKEQYVPRDNTSQGTLRPKRQYVPRDETSQRQNVPETKLCRNSKLLFDSDGQLFFTF